MLPGQTAPQDLGQIQLARFINKTGLESTGDNLFLETAASGPVIVLRIAAIGIGLCLLLGPALAMERVRLKAEVTVNAEVLNLGDLVEGASGPAAETPVFRAPALGETGTIQTARIAEAAG